MESERPLSAFISYSWDSPQHESWVLKLTNDLRNNGVDANIDKFITQTQTVNLNVMMVRYFKESDYVIFVLTENYARRADNLQGGVGFETVVSLPELRRNPDRYIFVVRHKGSFEQAFPFHLRDYHVIEFSDESMYAKRLDELLRRIYNEPLYEKAPLGNRPSFEPHTSVSDETPNPETTQSWNITVPKKFTDQDRYRFMKDSFQELRATFHDLFTYVQQQDSDITVSEDQNDDTYEVRLFTNGTATTGLRMWEDKLGFTECISLSYGVRQFGNGCNEMLTCNFDREHGPRLNMTMHMFGEMPTTIRGIVETVWKCYLEPSLRQ